MPAAQIANFVFSQRSSAGEDVASKGLYSGEELDIGRSLIHTLLKVQDTSISTHHILITSIVFDEPQPDEANSVDPLVYMQVISKHGVTFYNSCTTRAWRYHIPQGKSHLLQHGDVLLLSKEIMIMVALRINCDRAGITSTFPPFGNCQVTSRTIGTGGFAKVVLASDVTNGQQLACKVIATARLSSIAHDEVTTQLQDNAIKNLRQRISREISIASRLDHPHIIRLHQVFKYQENIYIFQDLATGGDLMSYLTQHGPLGQSEVLLIAYQLVHAVHYLHGLGIVHRDLKPENVLRSCLRQNSRIMLADFGMSKQLSITNGVNVGASVSRMESQVGTYGWQAPEMRKSSYTALSYSKAVDVWAMGGIVVALLTNEVPESVIVTTKDLSPSSSSVPEQIRFISPAWEHVSKKGKAFVSDTLAVNEHERITAAEALQHSWFTERKYAADLQRAYQRVICDWERRKDTGLVPSED